jgi:hypothetical protein
MYRITVINTMYNTSPTRQSIVWTYGEVLVANLTPGNVFVISGTSCQRKKHDHAYHWLCYNADAPQTITKAITPYNFTLL